MGTPADPSDIWPGGDVGDVVAMRGYTFVWPFIPTEEELDTAEEVVSADPRLMELDDEERRHGVARLVMIITAEDSMVGDEEGSEVDHTLPLLGGMAVHVVATRHEGTIVRKFELLNSDGVE